MLGSSILRLAWRSRRTRPRPLMRTFPSHCHTQGANQTGHSSERKIRLALLSATVGCIGGSFVAADYGARDQRGPAVPFQVTAPSRSSYKYLICGGGLAAQEALTVFCDRDAGEDVLLVSPEWMDCSQWLKPPDSVPLSDEEDSLFKLFDGVHSIFSYAMSFLKKNVSPQVVIGRKVQKVDVSKRTALFDDGTEITFERCLIAVGSSMPEIPIGKVVSKEAVDLVSGAQSQADWITINDVIRNGECLSHTSNDDNHAHLTVVGGGWMSMAVGAALVDRGADVTFSHSEPAFLARYFPKYLGQELFSRFVWQSSGGVDTLSYAALRYILARQPLLQSFRPVEAEVHVGTVFDAFSIVDFRTDHVIFAPTLPSRVPIEVPSVTQNDGFVVNPELALASDVYAAGASISVGSGALAYPQVMRWSADHARATGRHAALNILGARKPYTYQPTLTVDLDSLCLRLHIIGDVNGSAESFGYFLRSKERNHNSSGGQLEIGALFCVKPAPLSHRGASQKLLISGIALWEGSKASGMVNIERTRSSATALLSGHAVTRPELEALMDSFATDELGISLFVDNLQSKKGVPSISNSAEVEGEDEKVVEKNVLKPLVELRKPSPRVIWRRHRSARRVPVRQEELLWVTGALGGTASPETSSSRISQAYADLLKDAAPKE